MKSEPRNPDLPIRVQIARDIPLLTFYLTCDRTRVGALLPSALALHPRGRLVLNLWALDDQSMTTGFGDPGPVGVAYLAAEVAGDEGSTVDGSVRYPARYWLQHWSNSAAVRSYARKASGLRIDHGDIAVERDGDILRFTLSLDDRIVVRAEATTSDVREARAAAYSIYYASRDGQNGEEVARYEIPSIADACGAREPLVHVDFEAGHPASTFISAGPQTVEAVSFRRMTLVPYLSSRTIGT